jgi:hypothetical protein
MLFQACYAYINDFIILISLLIHCFLTMLSDSQFLISSIPDQQGRAGTARLVPSETCGPTRHGNKRGRVILARQG